VAPCAGCWHRKWRRIEAIAPQKCWKAGEGDSVARNGAGWPSAYEGNARAAIRRNNIYEEIFQKRNRSMQCEISIKRIGEMKMRNLLLKQNVSLILLFSKLISWRLMWLWAKRP
jgi:hypothetical protein